MTTSPSIPRKGTRRSMGLAALAIAGLLGATSVPALKAFTPIDEAHATTTQVAPSAGFADLVDQVMPAVFSVEVELNRPVRFNGMQPDGQNGMEDFFRNMPENSPFRQFFKQFEQRGGKGENQQRMPQRHSMAQGSGFFISADGYAVTNNHVVADAEKVSIKMSDGKTYSAKVIGTDPKTDIAVLKVKGDGPFPFVSFADKAARVGDWVVAVGNPFGLGGTVTTGIISAEGRDIGSGPYDNYLQIDAPINRGNSGGPAFNLDGQVVGMNTAIFSPSGGSVGIGFAIPANMIKNVVNAIESGGSVTRGWLGVQIQPVSQDIADSVGLKDAEGAIIAKITPNSPAANSPLKVGDVITEVDGKTVADPRDLARKVAELTPGKASDFTVFRNGKARSVSVDIGKMPASEKMASNEDQSEPAQASKLDDLGLSLAPAQDGDGVEVTDVDQDSAAAEKGLAPGDVILEVAGVAVSEPDALEKAISQQGAKGQKSVLVLVRKGDSQHFITLPTSAKG